MEGNNNFNQAYIEKPYIDKERFQRETAEIRNKAADAIIEQLKKNPNALNEFLQGMREAHKETQAAYFDNAIAMKKAELGIMGKSTCESDEFTCPYKMQESDE